MSLIKMHISCNKNSTDIRIVYTLLIGAFIANVNALIRSLI